MKALILNGSLRQKRMAAALTPNPTFNELTSIFSKKNYQNNIALINENRNRSIPEMVVVLRLKESFA